LGKKKQKKQRKPSSVWLVTLPLGLSSSSSLFFFFGGGRGFCPGGTAATTYLLFWDPFFPQVKLTRRNFISVFGGAHPYNNNAIDLTHFLQYLIKDFAKSMTNGTLV
jgi:hypothetical protein